VNRLIPGEIIEGKHPALVPREDFLQINGVLRDKHHGRTYNKEEESLPLKIFTVCDQTDTPYTGYLNRKKNLYYYKTRGKGTRKNRSAKALNGLFADYLLQFEMSPEIRPM